MPQIVEYVNREGITPTDRGVEARVQQGRRIGASFNQVAESLRDFGNRTAQQLGSAIRDAGDAAVAWQDQRQIHQGATMGAGIFNQLTNSQNDTVNGIDPNDPAYSSKVDMALQQWREQKLEPTLDQFYQGFTTEKSKAWAEQHIDQMRQHFYTAGAAETAKAASLGVKTGIQNTLTSLGNTVVQDPSSVDTALNLWESSVTGIVGSAHGINAGDAANAQTSFLEAGRKKIVNDAASSAIQKAADPEAEASKWIKKYPQYITGDEALKLGKAAKVQNRVNESTDRQIAAQRRQAADDKVKTDSGKILLDRTKIDPSTGKVTLQDGFFQSSLDIIRNNPDAPNAAATAESLIRFGQSELSKREPIVSDQDTKDNLYTRLWDNDNPTTMVDILNAKATDKLSAYDSANLLNLRKAIDDQPIETPIFKEIMGSVKGLLGTDPNGHEAFGKFVSAFLPEYQRQVRAGTLQPNALDLNDPNSFISQVLKPYRRDPAQMFLDRVSHGMIEPGALGGLGNIPAPTGTRPGQVPPKPVKSIEDAQKLNPGTRYVTPDGKVFVR